MPTTCPTYSTLGTSCTPSLVRLHVLSHFATHVQYAVIPSAVKHHLAPSLTRPPPYTGKGASGIVVLAKDVENSRPVAIKLLERGPQVNDYTDREAFTHRLLNHPHVVKMKVCKQPGVGFRVDTANLTKHPQISSLDQAA